MPPDPRRREGREQHTVPALATESPDTKPASTHSTGDQVNKFNWLRTVLADKALGGSDKTVLAYVAIFGVMNGGSSTFRIRQDTLAEHCGLSESSVSRAIRHAKKLGYIDLSQPRKSGWGQHGADELRLTLPKSPVNLNADSEKSSVRLTADSPESPVTGEKVTRQVEGYRKEYGSLHGSSKEKGPAARPTPAAESHRAPLFCPKHPDGPDHDDPCRRCKRWRQWLEQEPARTAERRRQEVRARRAACAACRLCDEEGWLLGADGGATEQRCTHTGDGRAEAARASA